MKLNEFQILRENYIVYRFNDQTRHRLAELFPPKYPEFVGNHITIKFPAKPNDLLPEVPKVAKIVGHADNGEGLEALVVEIDGDIHRPDGKIYHITWSLDRKKGFKPVDSNTLIAQGYQPVDPIEIMVVPEIVK
jgi:hypothetical protein